MREVIHGKELYVEAVSLQDIQVNRKITTYINLYTVSVGNVGKRQSITSSVRVVGMVN
jgi:hypothetical protein